jgi:nucleoside-diphosphate-sugar epimerase
MSKQILITGGAGFVGSHLADGLLKAGHQVRILDDLSAGQIISLRTSN